MAKTSEELITPEVLIHTIRVGPERNLVYLVVCRQTKEALLVDCGFDVKVVLDDMRLCNAKLTSVFATHGHWDHAQAIPELLTAALAQNSSEIKVISHKNEAPRLANTKVRVDHLLSDHEEFVVGKMRFEAIHTPGHTEGGCCLLLNDRFLFSGDTLFIGQCGRTDLPGGSEKQLFDSLQRLKKLSPNVVILPGHDYGRAPNATLKDELKLNPTLRAKTFKEFQAIP